MQQRPFECEAGAAERVAGAALGECVAGAAEHVAGAAPGWLMLAFLGTVVSPASHGQHVPATAQQLDSTSTGKTV